MKSRDRLVLIEEVVAAMGESLRLGLRTHVPGRVVTYDPATQRASVQVELRTVVRLANIADLPAGAELIGTPPEAMAVHPPKVVPNIPVIFPGTESAYLTVPITPGVTGTLHVHDRDLEKWNQADAPVDPVFTWTHLLENSEFHPGMRPATRPIATPTDLTATVVEGPLVKIARDADDWIAKATPLIAALDAFANATPVSMDGGTAIHTAFKNAWLTNGPLVPATKGQVK